MLEETMKNKMLAILLAGVLALGAVACGGGDDAEDGGTTDTTSEAAS
jgi:ABC-type glycerol-3-phosphate transport system substrate-binding protein